MISSIYVILLTLVIVNVFNKNRYLTYFNIAIMFLLGISRNITVGTDTMGYEMDFHMLKGFDDVYKLDHGFEWGFLWLIITFKKYVTNEYLPFVSLIFIPFLLGVFNFIKYKRVSYPLAIFFLYTWGYYFLAFNIMRQMMTLGLMLMCLPILYKGKYVKYAVTVILISLLFHKSGILMLGLIPLHYYIVKKGLFPQKALIYGILIISFALFFFGKTFMQSFLMPIVLLLEASSEHYIMGMGNKELGWMFNLGQTLITCFIVFFYKRGRMDFEFLVFVCGISLYNIMGMFSVVAPRLACYWTCFGMVLLPYMQQSDSIKKRKFKYILFFVGVLAYSLYRFLYSYHFNNLGEVNPFVFR